MSKKNHKNKIGILFIAIAIFFFVLTLAKIFSQAPENVDTNSESDFESINYTDQEEAREDINAKTSKDTDKELDIKSEDTEIRENYISDDNTENDSDSIESPEMVGDEEFTFSVLGVEEKIPFNQRDSLYEVMNVMRENGLITFKDRSFSGLGSYIYSINNVEENRREGKYWIYYINGKSANVGVSNYVLKNNDEIEWRLETDNY